MRKFILALILGLMSAVGLYARENSPWKEIQCVEIPAGTTVNHGVTRSGNPKAWVVIGGDINVPVSPKSAERFERGEIRLELVKWQNTETKKFRYSTRILGGDSKTSKADKNVDLKEVF